MDDLPTGQLAVAEPGPITIGADVAWDGEGLLVWGGPSDFILERWTPADR